MSFAKLVDELTNDPEGIGYAGWDKKQIRASLLAETRPAPTISITGQEIFEATAAEDLALLSADQRAMYYAIIGMGTILVNGANTKAALLAMFGVDTDTRANLAALQTRNISRAQELGIPKNCCGLSDIEKARP